MSQKVPAKIAKEIKAKVYAKANAVNYLNQTRTANGQFIARLVSDREVGGILNNYMESGEIRTYIKDAILNRYSKDVTQQSQPNNMSEIIKKKFGFPVQEVASDGKRKIRLFEGISNNHYVVVADGTFLKWETALRKALLYLPGNPALLHTGSSTIYILLNIFAQKKKINPADKKHLDETLAFCNARAHIFGEN